MIVEAVISKGNVVDAVFDKVFGSFVFAMTAKSHTVIENRSKAYYLVSIRINEELNVVQMPVVVAGKSVKHEHITQLITCTQFVRNIEIFEQFKAVSEIIHRRYHADFLGSYQLAGADDPVVIAVEVISNMLNAECIFEQ